MNLATPWAALRTATRTLYKCRIFILTVTVVTVASRAEAVVISPSPTNGLNFEQLDFTFDAVTQLNSNWGQINVDPPALATFSGMPNGYVNVFSPLSGGWAVQNLYVDAADGLGPVGTYFSLGASNPGDITSFSARVEYTPAPLASFGSGGDSLHSVFAGEYNAEGAGDADTDAIGAPTPVDALSFQLTEPSGVLGTQPNLSNVQAAKDQCFPMSIANSLQYLENTFPQFQVPNPHVKGLKGDNTLVGQLDTKSNRNATSRTDGNGVWFVPMMQGKFSYLQMNGLQNQLTHKHQGVGYGGAGNQLPAGNFSSSGITSRSDGANVTIDWLFRELQSGEDVELVFTYDDAAGSPRGGHAVRAFEWGRTGGKPWIRYAHDRQQTNQNDPTDTKGLETVKVYLEDLDMDGMLNFGTPDRELRFALSESIVPEPTAVVLGLAAVATFFLLPRGGRNKFFGGV